MKDIAVLILVVILSAAILQPITEAGLLVNEKIKTSSALINATEVAKRSALTYDYLRDGEAVLDESTFYSEFIDVFEVAMDVTYSYRTGNELHFVDNSSERNMDRLDVTVSLVASVDSTTGRTITRADLRAETDYVFKTKLLKEAADALPSMDYTMVTERSNVMRVVY